MGHLEQWARELPTVLGLLLVLLAPGVLTLRLLGIRRSLAWAFAPAWSCAIAGLGGVLLEAVGIPFTLWSFLVLAAVGAVLASVVRRALGPPQSSLTGPDPRVRVSPLAPRSTVLAAVLPVAAAMIAHAVPVLFAVDPGIPNFRNDPMFHYNGINAVLASGDASSLSAMDTNYGLRVLPITYPSVWHALASLVAHDAHIIPVAHAFSYLVVPWVFYIGVGVLAREAFPDHRFVATAAPLIALWFPAFPTYTALSQSFWPNELGIAVMPGVLAFGIAVANALRRHYHEFGRVRSAGAIGLLGLGVLGMSAAHPSAFFTLVWVTLPGALLLGLRAVRHLWSAVSRRAFALLCTAAVIIGSLVAAWIATQPKVVAALSTDMTRTWADLGAKVSAIVLDWPVGATQSVFLRVGATAIAFAIGLVVAWHQPLTRWLAGAWLAQLALVAASLLPLPVFTAISGLWYGDPYRLFAYQVVFSTLLLALALETAGTAAVTRLARAARDRDRSCRPGLAPAVGIVLAVVCLLVGTAGFGKLRYRAVGRSLSTISAGMPIGSPQELHLLRTLDRHLPPGALIVGDPVAGVGYAPAMSRTDSVFTQASRRVLDVDGNFLAEHFRDIHTDLRVCEVVQHYGIGYFYQDSAITYRGESRAVTAPGFYGVDTSRGFTLIERAGSVSLWRIDMCGKPKRKGSWWQTDWRSPTVLPEDPNTPHITPPRGSFSFDEGAH